MMTLQRDIAHRPGKGNETQRNPRQSVVRPELAADALVYGARGGGLRAVSSSRAPGDPISWGGSGEWSALVLTLYIFITKEPYSPQGTGLYVCLPASEDRQA